MTVPGFSFLTVEEATYPGRLVWSEYIISLQSLGLSASGHGFLQKQSKRHGLDAASFAFYRGDIRKWLSWWEKWSKEGRRASEIHMEQVTAVCMGAHSCLKPSKEPNRMPLRMILRNNYSGIVMYQLQNLSGQGRPLGLQPPTRPRPPPAASEEALSQNSWEALALGKTGPAGQGVVHWSWSQDTGRADGTGHSTKGREGAAVPSESMISVAFHRRQEAPALPPPTTFQVLTEVTTGKKRGFLCCDTSKQSDIICYGKRSQQIKTLTHQTNLHTLQTTPSARTKQIKAFCPHDKLPSYDFFSHFNMSKIGMS